LKQTGAALTGKAGPNATEQYPLTGTIDGDKLTFDVTTPGPVLKFTLTLVDGHLRGEATADIQGQALSAKVDAQRKKSLLQ
jgi:hypothetical protein